ncbi:MAG: hypothetical protein OQK04_06420 [Kangiellaceae bacterium]|nr:hypothetical protein [Kangiellaceae bacterium]MCW8998333.1 hypothetical protein [Kangiellaceae bacterium]
MIKIDYSKYSLDELLDVKANIDAEAYPERYKALLKVLEEKIAAPEELKRENVDHSLFQELESDPVAKKVRWASLSDGGSKVGAHKLVEVNPTRMEFKPSKDALVFTSFFVSLSFIVMIASVYYSSTDEASGTVLQTIFPILIGIVLAITSIFTYRSYRTPIIFDKVEGFYWKDRKESTSFVDKTSRTNRVKLNDIHALQLLYEYVQGSESWYERYELNLVLNHGERVNVVDHEYEHQLKSDAKRLSRFLEIPVWDAIEAGKDRPDAFKELIQVFTGRSW